MKKIIIILVGLIPAILFAQQFPFFEGYNINPYSLNPAYAGIHKSKTIFMDYRSDWSGLEGGPVTYQLSYNDRFKNNVGLGGKFIYDKTDIFKQTLILGTYTYKVSITKGHLIHFGLSAGMYRNSVDLSKYYNNPDYVQDLVLFSGTAQSKIKLATDISALYRVEKTEVGILFSNIMFGSAKYSKSSISYKPLKNFQIHASQIFNLSNRISFNPIIILRGGQSIPTQIEIAPSVILNKRLWANVLYRSGGIIGAGFGGEVYKGLMFNYSYNMSSNVDMNTFGSHQITIGVGIFKNSASNKAPQDLRNN